MSPRQNSAVAIQERRPRMFGRIRNVNSASQLRCSTRCQLDDRITPHTRIWQPPNCERSAHSEPGRLSARSNLVCMRLMVEEMAAIHVRACAVRRNAPTNKAHARLLERQFAFLLLVLPFAGPGGDHNLPGPSAGNPLDEIRRADFRRRRAPRVTVH